MKILVFGGTRGEICLVNKYIEKSNADIALCTGNFGIFYREKEKSKLPTSFLHNDFYKYLEGRENFLCPVYTVRGPYDNLFLCKQLIEEKIKINNFNLVDDGCVFLLNDISENLIDKNISIGGVGGSYSPKLYNIPLLFKKDKRHFNYQAIEKLSNKKVDVLIMYDLIGEGNKKQVLFSQMMFDIINKCNPFYCFVGKYKWWSCSDMLNSKLVTLPYIQSGYFIVDTKSWDAEAVRLDFGGGSDSVIR